MCLCWDMCCRCVVMCLCCVGESMDDKPKEVNPEVTLERDEELLKVSAAVTGRSGRIMPANKMLSWKGNFSLSCNHTSEK